MILSTLDYLNTWIERAIGNPASWDIIAIPLAKETTMHRRDFSVVGIFGRHDVMTSVIFHKYLFLKLAKSNPVDERILKPYLPTGFLPQINVV